MEDNSNYRQTIEQREFEMREVVKTLEEFSGDKKRVEREYYQIQLMMKIKDDNNMLKDSNFDLCERL